MWCHKAITKTLRQRIEEDDATHPQENTKKTTNTIWDYWKIVIENMLNQYESVSFWVAGKAGHVSLMYVCQMIMKKKRNIST